MPTASPRPAALVRRVVFVDGVRTPFGRARKDGLYAHTRADDLSVKTVRELLRRLCWTPPEELDAEGIAGFLRAGGARPWQIELVAQRLADTFETLPGD